MRSATLLTSTVAIAMACSSAAAAAAAAVPQQQTWYPEFASDYESGRCTTSPSPALKAFAAAGAEGAIAQNDLEGCCATWFPDQEGCGCLGGCPADTAAAPTAALTAEPQDAPQHWYPKFSTSYEAGSCVKAGVNTNEEAPSYYTMEGGFLHDDLHDCCARWFGQQENKNCMDAMEYVTSQPSASVTVNATRYEEAVVEPAVVEAHMVHAVEETI